MSLLDFLFKSDKKLTQVETVVLDSVATNMSMADSNLLRSQITNISKIQRLDNGREVDFYYGKLDATTNRFEMKSDVARLAKVTLKSRDSGHQVTASVQLVKGKLFSINFNGPPNDLRGENLSIDVKLYPLNAEQERTDQDEGC